MLATSIDDWLAVLREGTAERGMSEWLQHRDDCAQRKTLLLNGQMPGWSVAWLCLLLGRVPAMPGPSCWGCVPTPAAPLSPFRAEEPEGPSALISLQGYLESHLQIGLVFPL